MRLNLVVVMAPRMADWLPASLPLLSVSFLPVNVAGTFPFCTSNCLFCMKYAYDFPFLEHRVAGVPLLFWHDA